MVKKNNLKFKKILCHKSDKLSEKKKNEGRKEVLLWDHKIQSKWVLKAYKSSESMRLVSVSWELKLPKILKNKTPGWA